MTCGQSPPAPPTAHVGPRASTKKRSNTLVRIRFPPDLLQRLDGLAERLRRGGRRKIPRAALVRALVRLRVDVVDDLALGEMLQADPVKRGAQRTAAATPAAPQGATRL